MSNENQLAPIAHPADDVLALAPTARPSFWCSLPALTDEQKALVYAAREGESLALADLINVELSIENLLIHPVQIARENGEILNTLRIVLISPTGELYSSCSNGIRQCIETLSQIYGLPPWKPAKRFKLKQVTLANSRRTFKLEPIASPLTEGKAKK